MGLPLSLLGGEGRPSKRALMKSAFTLSPAMLMPCFFIISFRSLFTLPDSSSRVKKGLGGGGGGGLPQPPPRQPLLGWLPQLLLPAG